MNGGKLNATEKRPQEIGEAGGKGNGSKQQQNQLMGAKKVSKVSKSKLNWKTF